MFTPGIYTGVLREQQKLYTRHPHWRYLRADYIEVYYYCAACGSLENLQVHHIKPVSKFPALELVWSNLITLCGRCHYTIGHGGRSWKHYNSQVVEVCELIVSGVVT